MKLRKPCCKHAAALFRLARFQAHAPRAPQRRARCARLLGATRPARRPAAPRQPCAARASRRGLGLERRRRTCLAPRAPPRPLRGGAAPPRCRAPLLAGRLRRDVRAAAAAGDRRVRALHADGGHGPVDPFRRRSADRRRGRICRPWAHRLASPPPVPAAAARYAPGQHASFSGGHAGPRGFAAAAHRADLDRAAANSVSDPRATGRSGGLILFDLVIIYYYSI